jgi:hypothetical protein
MASPETPSSDLSSQRILDFGDHSIYIDADPGETSSNSVWLRIGRIESEQSQQARLTASQARSLAYALLVHAEDLEDRQKRREVAVDAAAINPQDDISVAPFERGAVARRFATLSEFPISRVRRYRSHEG